MVTDCCCGWDGDDDEDDDDDDDDGAVFLVRSCEILINLTLTSSIVVGVLIWRLALSGPEMVWI